MKGLNILAMFLLMMSIHSYADIPDFYQNSGSNNIAYDVPSKFYFGANLGASWMNHHKKWIDQKKLTESNNKSTLLGFLGGYKWNEFMAIELNVDRLGRMTETISKTIDYRASLYQFNIAALISYPLIRSYHSIFGIFGRVGYGLQDYRKRYSDHHNFENHYHGAYHVGFGLNLDLRSDISLRISDTYYQVPGHHQRHSINVLGCSLYYNFV